MGARLSPHVTAFPHGFPPAPFPACDCWGARGGGRTAGRRRRLPAPPARPRRVRRHALDARGWSTLRGMLPGVFAKDAAENLRRSCASVKGSDWTSHGIRDAMGQLTSARDSLTRSSTYCISSQPKEKRAKSLAIRTVLFDSEPGAGCERSRTTSKNRENPHSSSPMLRPIRIREL